MELEKYGIPNELAERIIQGIVEGQYNLLLGAGFSMSAFDSSNRNLPSGPALARELTGEFKTGLIDPDASNLTLAFDEAKHSAKEGKLAEFLRSRFSGAKPTWHSVVMEFPWTRIWSLNIDDLFEHENFRKDGRALPHPITWKDKLEVPSAEKKTLQVVHLHGSVSSFGGDLSKLVFSIREYAKAVRENGDWHSEFWSQWLQKPFLVIGARLVDEFDLNEAISAGNNSETATGLKSLAVVLNPSGTDRRRLERAKLLVVDATAEDFFSALLQDVTDFRKRNVDLPEFPVPAISAARFNQ